MWGGKTGSVRQRATARKCASCKAEHGRRRGGRPRCAASCVVLCACVHGTSGCVSAANISKKNYKHKSLLRFINIMPHNAYSLIRVFPKTRHTPLDLQKTAFHTAKGRLLQPQKPYFATRKTAFCKAARNVLIAKKIFHGLQFIAFPSVCLALQPGCITFAILLQECAATGAGHVTVRLWRLL